MKKHYTPVSKLQIKLKFYNRSSLIIPKTILLCVGILMFPIFTSTTLAQGTWEFETQIDLAPATSVANYQVKVELKPSNFEYCQANSDGSDIRFKDNANNPLDYWIEEWVLDGTSTIWVEIPTIGTTSFKMEFGNPIATSESDGSATFLVFDDFEQVSAVVDPSKWIVSLQNTSMDHVVAGGQLRVFSAKSAISFDWRAINIKSIANFSDPLIIESETAFFAPSSIETFGGLSGYFFHGEFDSSFTPGNINDLPTTIGTSAACFHSGELKYGLNNGSPGTNTFSFGTLYDLKAEFNTTFSKAYLDGTELDSDTPSFVASPVSIGLLIGDLSEGYAGAKELRVNSIRARKFAATESIATVNPILFSVFIMIPPISLFLDGQNIVEGTFTLNSFSKIKSDLTEISFTDLQHDCGPASVHANMGSGIPHAFKSTLDPTLNGPYVATKFEFVFDATIPDLAPITSTMLTIDNVTGITVYLPFVTGGDFHQAVNEDDNGTGSGSATSSEAFQLSTTNAGFSMWLDLYPSSNPNNFFAVNNPIGGVGCGPCSGGSAGGSGGGQGHGTLPVELLSFKAKKIKEHIELSWKTASEKNNKGFEILKSNNATDWEPIGFVDGQGSTTISTQYQSIDLHPFAGINYYRLKQIDFDGQYKYSNIVALNMEDITSSSLIAFPNPTKEELIFSFEATKTKSTQLEMFDLHGRKLISRTINVQKGLNNLSLDLRTYPKGIYIVTILNASEKLLTSRVVKF